MAASLLFQRIIGFQLLEIIHINAQGMEGLVLGVKRKKWFMINIKTNSEELWRVLPEEHDKALYWLKKHFGGEARYEQMRDDLHIRCRQAEWPVASEVVDYTSKEGNHWVFEVRTLLTDGQLCGKQSHDTQELREYADYLRIIRGYTVFNNCKTLKL